MRGLADTAKAFATFSLVPYLGIIFCPAAVVLGAVGIVRSRRSSQVGDSSVSFYVSTIVGLGVLGIQIWFWWILYHVPIWASLD
jgi:drug/metabolite transporter (DMT)-like permease